MPSTAGDPPLALAEAPSEPPVNGPDHGLAQGEPDAHALALSSATHSDSGLHGLPDGAPSPTPTPSKAADTPPGPVAGDAAPPQDPQGKAAADPGRAPSHAHAVPMADAQPGASRPNAAGPSGPAAPEEPSETVEVTETIDVEVKPTTISGPDAATQALIDKQLQQQANENALTEVRERIAENRARNEVANALAEARVEMWKKAAKAFKEGAG